MVLIILFAIAFIIILSTFSFKYRKELKSSISAEHAKIINEKWGYRIGFLCFISIIGIALITFFVFMC